MRGATAWIEEMKLVRSTRARVGNLGRVVVVGGGNTAIDVARECAQLGATEVTMVYRRAASEMTGYAHELSAAKKEGVRFVTNAQPAGFVRDVEGKLRAIKLLRTEAGRAIPGTEHEIACDIAALAIGQSKMHALAAQFPGVVVDARGCIVVDPETCATGNPKVYSGGDCVNGGKEVVNAVADGRNAARYLMRHRWRT